MKKQKNSSALKDALTRSGMRPAYIERLLRKRNELQAKITLRERINKHGVRIARQEDILKYNRAYKAALVKHHMLHKASDQQCCKCPSRAANWFVSRIVIAKSPTNILPLCTPCCNAETQREELKIGGK